MAGFPAWLYSRAGPGEDWQVKSHASAWSSHVVQHALLKEMISRVPSVLFLFLRSRVCFFLGSHGGWVLTGGKGGCGRVACATLSLQVGRTDQTYLWQCRATRTRESRLHGWQSSAESFFPTAGHGSELVHPTFVGVTGMCSSVGWTV